MNKFLKIIIICLPIFVSSLEVQANTGTIDSTNHSALLCTNDTCTTSSQINFGYFTNTPSSNVSITDSALSGYIWGESFGWVVLNCSDTTSGCSSTNGNFKVSNDGEGNLSGYAWGENAGWVNFGPFLNNSASPVSINSSGQLAGWAWAQNYGWIKFDCGTANACVETSWSQTTGSSGSSVGGTTTPPVLPPPVIPIIPPITPPVTPPIVPPAGPVVPPVGPIIPPSEPVIPSTPIDNQPPINDQNPTPVTQVFIDQATQFITDGLNTISDIFPKALDQLSEITKIPVVNVSSKALIAVGAISGASISIATVLFANPLSFSELFLIPLRIWSILLAALGIKKRNVPWGTVYDSVTKQPLDPAYVILQDLDGNEVATSITDLDGRYGFLVPAGRYRIIANKSNYEFPSKKLGGKDQDELYHDLYFNEIIEVQEGGVITKNIPMDPLKFDWNEFAKKDQKLMKFFSIRDVWVARITSILFAFGFLIAVVAVVGAPVFYNVIILAVYLLLFIFKRTILKPRAFGHIKLKETKDPLSFSVLKIFHVGSDHEVLHKVADKTGKYYCLVPNGTYYAKIENKNLDESYSLAYTSELIEVKKGYINKKFEV